MKQMKFYNPFKPHVVEYGGGYVVRLMQGAFQWTVLDRGTREFYWWYTPTYWISGLFKNKQEACNHLNAYLKSTNKKNDFGNVITCDCKETNEQK